MTGIREIGEPDEHGRYCVCATCEEQYAPPIEEEEDD